MRQLGDMLVWLGLFVVVAAVVYFTPRIANYVRLGAAGSCERPMLRTWWPIRVRYSRRLPEKAWSSSSPCGSDGPVRNPIR